jgi:site-specific DNA-cytosine methylase
MLLLEFFSGTGSVGRAFREAGHTVVSVDVDGRFGAEIVGDILQLDYKALPTPDIVWSSPPCCQYARCRTRAKTPRNLVLADSLVAKALEIIRYFEKLNPDLIWFVENGMTMLWGREVAKELTTYKVVDYCQYNGPGYRKRTRIAHSDNLLWEPRPLCNSRTCSQCVDGKHQLTAQKGPSRGKDFKKDVCSTDQLHTIPKELCDEIYCVCVSAQWHFP